MIYVNSTSIYIYIYISPRRCMAGACAPFLARRQMYANVCMYVCIYIYIYIVIYIYIYMYT